MAPPQPTHAGAARTPRYAPWLQRALRVKEETERFWQQQQASGSSTAEPRETGGGLKNSAPLPSRAKPGTIWEAVEQDDAAEVKHLLETSPALVFQRRDACADGAGDRDRRGGATTVLHEAAHAGSHQVVQLVLRHIETRFPGETLRVFVDAFDTSQSRTTALIAACRGAKGDVKHRLKVVQLLIHAGADIEHQDAHGDNAVHWCARTSNNVLLRWLLKATDAAANAVYAENFKREKPLDIAKHALANATSNRFSAQNVYTSLRSVDRKCNVRLKMQVIKRHAANLQSERTAAFETQWATALAAADDAVEASERFWKQSIARAEENRLESETTYVKEAVEAARLEASQWLGSKDGKNYLKKHLSIATEELKLEVLRGKITKPKDMKKAATHRASEAYVSLQAEAARKSALESWRAKRPLLPSDPEKLIQMLG